MKQKQKAFGIVTIKSVDEDERIIRGLATTIEADRSGDIVEPDGAEFKLPLPLLWQHNHDKPIGKVIKANVTKNGIEIEAQLAKVDEEGVLSERLKEAWQSIKTGLVNGLSIGFRPIEYSFLDSGGIRFSRWEWYELSTVTIPANSQATIQNIKSLFDEKRAAPGKVVVKVDQPSGVADKKTKSIKIEKDSEMKTIAEQIADFKAAREKKAYELEAIINKSAETGETLDAEQSEAYDTLESEIEAIDKHIERLLKAEKIQGAKAKSVEKDAEEVATAKVKAPTEYITVKHNRAKDGIALAQMVKCIGRAQGSYLGALQIADSAGDSLDGRVKNVLKAAVAAGSTSNTTWAGNLVGDETSVYADFIEYLRPQTILGKFGTNGIPSLRNVPFRTPLIGQTSGGAGYWVGEGQGKPLTKFDFSRTTLDPLKVANIAVITEELLRSSSPSADIIIRDQLVAALRERLDIDFIDPGKAASSGVSPASILNGVSGIPSAGGTADDIREDLQAVFSSFIAANNAPTTGVWIMPSTVALALSLMVNPLGQPEFPGISMNGGTLAGLPVIVSEYIPTESDGAIVALINASDIYLGDDGGFAIDMSREASLQMDSAPSQDSIGTPPTATSLVSLWQTNSVGFRAEREINWQRRRDSAVAYLTGVVWGQAGS